MLVPILCVRKHKQGGAEKYSVCFSSTTIIWWMLGTNSQRYYMSICSEFRFQSIGIGDAFFVEIDAFPDDAGHLFIRTADSHSDFPCVDNNRPSTIASSGALLSILLPRFVVVRATAMRTILVGVWSRGLGPSILPTVFDCDCVLVVARLELDVWSGRGLYSHVNGYVRVFLEP